MSAWTTIARTELNAGSAASISFMNVGNIPNIYTDLAILLSARFSLNDAQDVGMRFNGDSGANYSMRLLYGDGSTRGSGPNTSSYFVWAAQAVGSSRTASTFSNCLIYIPNYASSTTKSISVDAVTENNATGANQVIAAGLWSGTSPITSITLDGIASTGGNFAQYTSATLYGIISRNSGDVTVS